MCCAFELAQRPQMWMAHECCLCTTLVARTSTLLQAHGLGAPLPMAKRGGAAASVFSSYNSSENLPPPRMCRLIPCSVIWGPSRLDNA
jgi:hypothetical protein